MMAEMSGKKRRNTLYKPHPSSFHCSYTYLRSELIFSWLTQEFAVFIAVHLKYGSTII